MLLQVVPDSWDIGVHLDPVGEPDASDLAQRRVWLLGGRGFHLGAYAALLRRALERTSPHLVGFLNARTPDQLINSRHFSFSDSILGRESLVSRLHSMLLGPIKPRDAVVAPVPRSPNCLRWSRGCSNKPPKDTYALGGNISIYGTGPVVSISGPFQVILNALLGYSPPGAGAAAHSGFSTLSSVAL